jgi:predicted transcriptional regulator
LGTTPKEAIVVRLDPELRSALARRAERDHEAASSVIRKALRAYLKTG